MRDVVSSVGEEHIGAALGNYPCDLLVKGRLVNTITGDIEETGVAIYNKRVVGFGDYEADKVIECEYICPGLIDAHVHIESGMLSPLEFSRALASHGTTAIIADPHEIANATGMEGLLSFIREARDALIKILFMAPSCVPASPMEMSFGHIDAKGISELKSMPDVIGLGEMMDYPGVLKSLPEVLDKLSIFSINDGHAPGLTGEELNAYIAAGIDSDHETSTVEEGLEKLRKGMWLYIREGSGSKNLKDLMPIVKRYGERLAFATDDRDPMTLVKKGHIDDMVRTAVADGVDPVKAIRLATINPAERFRLPMGAVMPGRAADILLLDDLESFKIKEVLLGGAPLSLLLACDYRNKRPVFRENTVVLPQLKPEDIMVKSESGRRVKVIEAEDGSLLTGEGSGHLKSVNGVLVPDTSKDILKIASIRRYPGAKMCATGFVKGFGLKKGAFAQTISHDSHNIICVGVDDADILSAVLRLGQIGGGIVAIEGGKILNELPLPFAGLMSDRTLEEVASGIESVLESIKSLGCRLEDPVMTLSFMGLSVIPGLKITCRGLIRVNEQIIVSVFSS